MNSTSSPRSKTVREHVPRLLAVLTIIVAFPVAAHGKASSSPRTEDSAEIQPFVAPMDRRVDVGGYKLYIKCVGTGAPTIVLDNEYYLDSWNTVQASLRPYARTCDYDAEGHGLSDAGHASVSSSVLVRDAYRLLHNGHIPGPYVLVGLDFGGTTVRLYASEHRRDISGLVLIDAVSPELLRYVPGPSTEIDVRQSQMQLAAANTLGGIPLVVLSHEKGHCLSHPVEDRWQYFQRGLTRLSLNSIQIEAIRSGCDIPGNRPQLVVEAIKHVLIAVRRHNQLSCGIAFDAFGGICVYSSPRRHQVGVGSVRVVKSLNMPIDIASAKPGAASRRYDRGTKRHVQQHR